MGRHLNLWYGAATGGVYLMAGVTMLLLTWRRACELDEERFRGRH